MSLLASGVDFQGVKISLVRVHLNGRSFCLSPLETVSATVEVTVKVTSQNYSKDLENKQSKAYKDFTKTFTKQVTLGDSPTQGLFSPPLTPWEEGGGLKTPAEYIPCVLLLAFPGLGAGQGR